LTNALNFDTTDCHVIGSCDIYTTKAASADKKLYGNIEKSLQSQHASVLRLSASLPPQASASLNLSRASPFGPLSQKFNRKTYTYLIATLNASHPDYDFSHYLRPTDFRREKSLKKVMNVVDSTLTSLRPKYSSSFEDYTARWSNAEFPTLPLTPYDSERWNPRMWRLIDNEMILNQCQIYCYAPEDDPFDGEEGSLWSFDYFFFNQRKKRVCHLQLRGVSIMGNTPPMYTPVKAKRPASGTWSLDGETGRKRAKYSIGDRSDDVQWMDGEEEGISGEWDEELLEESEVLDQGDEPIYIPSDADIGDESPCKGRGRLESTHTAESETPSKEAGGGGSPVRGISEEIAATMDP